MFRRLALAGISIGALILAFTRGDQVGFTVESVNRVEQVSAGSSLPALAAALVILIAYIVALDPEPAETLGPAASTTRRAVGWLLDSLLSLVGLSAVLALIPLAAEAMATGHFQWQFERDTATTIDWVLSLVGIALLFAGMALYWGLPPARGGQTIGQAVLGLRTVSTTGQPPALRACLLRGVMQPFAPLLWIAHLFSRRGAYFHDDLANVQVVTTRSVERAA